MVVPSGLPTESGTDSPDILDWTVEVQQEPGDSKEEAEEEQADYYDEQTVEAEQSADCDDASPEYIDQHCESVPDSSYVSPAPQFVPSFTLGVNLGIPVRAGRRTIQEKIAEQEKRAAALAQELMEVGIPVEPLSVQEKDHKILYSRKSATYGNPPVPKKTVPVSVIRKSPSAYAFSHEKFSDTRPPVVEQTPVVSIEQPMFASQLNGRVVFVPSVIFRVDGMVSGSADQLYIPQSTYTYNNFIRPRSPSQSLLDDAPLLIKDNDSSATKIREERLSTKLKRIKDKAGNVGEESPRGFLNQKIAALKRSENALQREYEEVSKMPIDNLTGISSAQNLKRHLAFTNAASSTSHEVLMQMLRGAKTNSVSGRGSSKSKKMRTS